MTNVFVNILILLFSYGHNLSKNIRQINDSQKSEGTKKASNNVDTQQQREKNSRLPRKSAFIVGDSMIKKN